MEERRKKIMKEDINGYRFINNQKQGGNPEKQKNNYSKTNLMRLKYHMQNITHLRHTQTSKKLTGKKTKISRKNGN